MAAYPQQMHAMPPGVFGVPFVVPISNDSQRPRRDADIGGPCVGGRSERKERPSARAGGRGRKKADAVKETMAVTPLYKTRLCNFYSIGACQKGSACSYAHGNEELRNSPDFERTSVCPVMLNRGTCDKPNCRYAHNAEDLRVAPGLLKTKMCAFHLAGACVVGEACRFAHSVEELQEAVAVQREAGTPQPVVCKRSNAELWESRRSAFAGPPVAEVVDSMMASAMPAQDIPVRQNSKDMPTHYAQRAWDRPESNQQRGWDRAESSQGSKDQAESIENSTGRETDPLESKGLEAAAAALQQASQLLQAAARSHKGLEALPASFKAATSIDIPGLLAASRPAPAALALTQVAEIVREVDLPLASETDMQHSSPELGLSPWQSPYMRAQAVPPALPARVALPLSAVRPMQPSEDIQFELADEYQESMSPRRVQSECGTEEDNSKAELPDTFSAYPARVVRGRVVVQLDDDEEPLSVTAPESFLPLANISPPERDLDNIPEEESPAEAAKVLKRMRGRQPAVCEQKRERVIVDVEDQHFLWEDAELAGLHNMARRTDGRPNSSDPPLVEVRRRAGNCVVMPSSIEGRCALSKATPTPCGVAGRFKECALCPRSLGQEGPGCNSGTCAACNCGLKVIARNTFLTFAEVETDQSIGSRRRSQSDDGNLVGNRRRAQSGHEQSEQ